MGGQGRKRTWGPQPEVHSQIRKARPRDWAVLSLLARPVPSSSRDVLRRVERDPWDYSIRRILLAGTNPRCPTRGSITTLLGDSTAVSDSGRPLGAGCSKLGLASLPGSACMQDKLKLQGRA